jgi:DNA-binding NtrC family response regulator
MGARVGICEDDAGLRSVLSRALAAEGFVVRATASGRDAVHIFSESAPELLVLDIAGVALIVSAPDRSMTVGADEELVAQSLHPLLDNAVRDARRAGDVAAVASQDGGRFLLRSPALR